ncbi:substrate-binding domain-containing protein, partial [Pelagibacteraceae bacterium]|nr:substrate-binding domain-containing protein [Pelagibacteraceae bacterium]
VGILYFKNSRFMSFTSSLRIILFILTIIFSTVSKADNKIIIASTTSTYDTGLLNLLNEEFYKKYEVRVQVLSLGTGQAIRTAKDGNAEILLVHHKPSEIKFMDNGYGIERHEIMYNDYVLVGPKNDNDLCKSVQKKFEQIYSNQSLFISRGDDSGTHRKELEMWDLTNIKVNKNKQWYLSVGQGMGSTLLIANEKKGYTLSDRSTWIAFNNRQNLKIVCEDFPPLFNQYGIILVNSKLNKNLNYKDAKKYIEWFKTTEVKELINNFKAKGKQLFYYNYN